MKKVIPTKKCKSCKSIFEKKINCSKKEWENTVQYCSRACINKGRSSWNKGILKTEEEKKHLHEVLKGRTCNTGKTHIKKGQNISPETQFKKGHKPWNTGKENPYFTGPNNPRWKGGVTPEHLKVRWSKKSKDFRNKMFERDNYTCTNCGRKRKPKDRVILNLHHIQPFSKHKNLRFEQSNVVTLCLECHVKTDTYGVNLK